MKDKPVVLGMWGELCCKISHLILALLFLGVQFEVFYNFLAGPRFKDAFQDPGVYLAVEPLFEVISFLGRNKFQGNCSYGFSSFFF